MRSISSTNAKVAKWGGIVALLLLVLALSYVAFFGSHGGSKHADYVFAALIAPLVPTTIALLGYITQRKFTKELQPLERELGNFRGSAKKDHPGLGS